MSSVYVVIPFILVAMSTLALAVAAWQRARSPGSLYFALVMVSVSVWLLSVAFEIASPEAGQKIFWSKAAYLGIAWVATFWLGFALDFALPRQNLFRRFGAWLGAIPAMTIALAITNELHGLIWDQITATYPDGRLALVYHHGLWFWIFTGYSYLVLCAGMVVLLRATANQPRVRYLQTTGLVAGMLLPWLANVVYLVGWPVKFALDPTPYGFTVTGLIFAWMLYRWRLFDTAPLAHEAILANTGDGYMVLDANGRIMEVNLLARQFLQLPAGSISGQPAASALSGWPELLDLLQNPQSAQVEFPTKNEPASYLEARLSDRFGGGMRFAGRVLILHDISRRRKAEEDLMVSERLYRLLVDAAPVGIVLTDAQGKITYASPKTYALHGGSAGQAMTGQSPLTRIHPEDRPRAAEMMQRALDRQGDFLTQEYRLLREDGTFFWGEVTSTPILDERRKSHGLLAITHDVTERKTLEIDLQDNLNRQMFINNLLQILYRPNDLLASLGQVLEKAGLFTGINRIYLCKDSADETETTITVEWSSPGITLRAKESALVRYAAIPSWKRVMEAHGSVLVEDIRSAPEDIAEYMSAWNVQSLAAFPIYSSKKHPYGFLGVETCERQRKWSAEDLDLLEIVCRIVSGAVAQIQVEAAEQRQRALAEALHDTASALNSTLNLDEVLDRVLINLEHVVPNVAANIALVGEGGVLRFVRWRGYDAVGEEMVRTTKMAVADIPTYRTMAESGEAVIISDTWMERTWTVTTQSSWIRSYAGVPIRIKGKVEGFINLDSAEPEYLSTELTYSLRVFAEQAAVAIENARLYDASHRRAEELSILNRIGLTLTTGLEMNQVLYSLFEECRRILPIDVFYVALYDAQNGKIEMPLYYHLGEFPQVEPRDIATHPGLTGEVILRGQTIYLPDTTIPEVEQQHGIIRLEGDPARSYAGVPLILLDQVVGVISMQNFAAHAYTAEQIRLLETIATQAAIAVWNARLYDQMKQMAITDSVTGLFTRRHFTALGRSEVERSIRYERKLSVLMVDIDHFKQVNDTYGHNAGDRVLQTVAQVCRQALRGTDIVGRWGGEEFSIVLPEADREGGVMIAERIRRMMADTEITLNDHKVHVTVSIGVAVLDGQSSTLEVLVDCADRALYMAKQGGRNQVRLV